MPANNPVSAYLAEIGRKGGQAKGARKARDPAHYKRLADMKRKAAAKRSRAAEPA